MFCVNCGTKNEDGAQFCVGCGATLNANPAAAPAPAPTAAPAPTPAPRAPKTQQEKYRMVGMIAVAAVAVLVLAILALTIFGGRGYKATTRQFIKATYSANAKKIFKLIPEKVLKEEFDSNKDRKEAVDDMEETLESMLEFYNENLDDWKYSFKITDSDKITGDDLKDLKEEYKDEYGLRISAAREVEVEFTIKYDDGDEEQEMDLTIYLIKVGGSWYLDVLNTGVL